MDKVRCILSSAALCIVAAFVALLPQFYLTYDIGNRYAMGWSPQFRASILIAISILAALYFILYAGMGLAAGLLSRWFGRLDWKRGAFDLALWIMAALLFRSVMAIAYATEEMPGTVLRIVDAPATKVLFYFVLPAGGCALRRRAFEKIVVGLYRILAVLCVLFAAQAFTWDIYSNENSAADIPAERGDKKNANSLYIFLFDEWSFDDTFGNPEFSLDHMPHLAEFLRHSTLFRNAHSPSVLTTVSIPRFLYQSDPRIYSYSLREMEWGLQHNDFLPLKLTSIFDLSDQHFKHLSGFLLYYSGIVGSHVDCLIPFYDYNSRYSLKERVLVLLHTQLSFLGKFGWAVPLSIQPQNWTGHEFQARIRPILNDILPRLPYKSIAFFHICLPHGPFIFDRAWNPLPNPAVGWNTPHLRTYLENVYAMDAVIGDIVRILKARGDYDSSLLVFLSDHSWKAKYSDKEEVLDRESFIPEKHVPLLIKYPGQVRGGTVETPIVTTELHPFFQDYLTVPEKMARWVSGWNAGTEPDALYDPE